MYESTFKREGFTIHPLEKNLKWGEIYSYLASQAIYIGTGLEIDSQHGFNFFWKKFISDFFLVGVWWNPRVWKCFGTFFSVCIDHICIICSENELFSKKVEPMLRVIFKPSPYINCLTCQIWVNFVPFQIFSRGCMMKPSRLKVLWCFFSVSIDHICIICSENEFFSKKVEPMLRVIFKSSPYINCLTCQIWVNFAPFQIFF